MATGKNDQMLIVVAISQARNFQKRPGWNIIIEATLDGETISSDEIPHDENPNFNTELAWEIDKKGFRMFRMQRIPIKLRCFAVEPILKAKELLGFVVIDLRLVHPKPQVPKWHTLLNPKYYWMKPEIRLCATLENDTGGLQVASTPSLMSVTSSPKTPPKTKRDKKEDIGVINTEILQPLLSDEEGYYQIGPNTAKDIFSLSVTIVFAGNLSQLLPSGIHMTDDEKGFYFYYSLLGNDVTTDSFLDLMEPSFPAERATVRIRSSTELLRQFFSSQPGLKVHLCSGDISLGCAYVPLNDLLVKNSTEIFMKPVSTEGMFELEPLDKVLKEPGEELTPFVGMSVTLRLEDQQPKVVVRQPSVINSPTKTREVSPPSTPPPSTPPRTKKDLTQSPPVKLPPSSVLSSSYDNRREDGTRLDGGGDSIDDFRKSDDETLHHYCFTLDMRHITFTVTDNIFYGFLRYSYPFFGTSTAIVTHPLMEVRKNVELSIPNGFCSFTFATTPEQTSRAFKSLPLRVEVVKRDRARNEETIIGMLSFNLAEVLKAGKSRITNADNKTGLRQVISVKTPIHSLNENVNFIGHAQTVIGLDDFGVTVLPPEIAKRKHKSPLPENDVVTEIEDHFPAEKPHTKTSIENEMSDDIPMSHVLEFRERKREMAIEIAMELEEWKKEQEDQFRKNLKAKEQYYMESLVNEWRKRDTEREMTLQRKLKECQELERKLLNALRDANDREKVLTAKEIELEQRKIEFERIHERQQSEVKSGYLRLRDEFAHRLLIENEKFQESENQNEKLKKEVKELEIKLLKESREREKIAEQHRVGSKPELRLESELHLASIEKVELERKLEAATKSKIHYKQQWGRCLRELARIKQKLETDARAQLYRQQQELEGMKREYLASESTNEKASLHEIKGQLEQIKQHVTASRLTNEENRKSGVRQISFLDSEEFDSDTEDTTFTSDDLSRLLKEKETLLEMGIYTDNDRIIRELDRQIEEAEKNQRS